MPKTDDMQRINTIEEFDRFCRFIDGFHDGGYVENDFMSKKVQAAIRADLATRAEKPAVSAEVVSADVENAQSSEKADYWEDAAMRRQYNQIAEDALLKIVIGAHRIGNAEHNAHMEALSKRVQKALDFGIQVPITAATQNAQPTGERGKVERALQEIQRLQNFSDYKVDRGALKTAEGILAAALSSPAKQAQEWMPIETAPREGRLLLWYPCYKVPRFGWWNHASKQWEEDGQYKDEPYISPTHWQPLPSPPTASST